MIIKEFERILDFRCEMRFAIEEQLKELSGFNVSAMGRIRHRKDGGYFIVTIPSEEHDGKSHKSMNINVSNTKLFEVHKAIIELNSTIIDAVMMKDNEVKIFFRFHRVELEAVNSIIMHYAGLIDEFRIVYLGEAFGILDSYRKIAQFGDVHYIELSSSIPPELMKIYVDPIIQSFGTSWNRQVRKIGENEIRALFKDTHNLLKENSEIKKVSEEDLIYESIFSNDLIYFFSKRTDEEKIPILGIPQKLTGKNFIFGFFIPSCNLAGFTKIVSEAGSKFKNWKISIKFSDIIEIKEK